MEIQYRLVPLFDKLVGLPEFPAGVRTGVRVRGLDLGPGRVPMTTTQHQRLREAEPEIDQMIQDLLSDLAN